MSHFGGAPGSAPGTAEAARRALVFTGFHWGLHAWAVYCVAGLVLAYFRFRHQTPYLPGSPIRAAFRGRWVGPVALAADLLAVLAVAFGVAASLPMGILQFQSGLSAVAGTSDSQWISLAILAALVAAYSLSAATRLDQGIRILSNINMALAILLCAFLVIAGPTDFLLRTIVNSAGDYVSGIIPLSLRLYPYEDQAFLEGWTLTWFIWWIAWAPFVGVFIARISHGRRIREFILGVLLAPTGFTLAWFGAFGGTAFYEELHGGGGVLAAVREDVTFALFVVFDALPLSPVLSAIAITLVFIFLVTSLDSATYVLGMLTTGGSMNPPRARKLAWGIGIGLLALALVLTRNIDGIRAAALLGAIPFTFVLLLQLVALLRALGRDRTRPEDER